MERGRHTRPENPANRPKHIKRSILTRVKVLSAAFALLGTLIFIMIPATMWGPNGQPLRNLSDSICYTADSVPASRGNILASDGRILATDAPFYNIVLDFSVPALTDEAFRRSSGPLADSLAALFPELSRRGWAERLETIRRRAVQGGPGSRSQKLRRESVNQLQLDRLRRFPIFRGGPLEGGFIVRQDEGRYRPFGSLARRTIGSPGQTGLEASFDDYLRGSDGFNVYVRLRRGVYIPIVDSRNVPVRHGRDILTTIDIDLQDIAETELRRRILETEAVKGTAVIMEVATGHILAISNLERNGRDVDDIDNLALKMRLEPGSTFKLATLMALLEEGKVELDRPVDCCSDGRYLYKWNTRGRTRSHLFSDSHPIGKTTVKGMFEQSSNIGFVKMIDREYRNDKGRFVDFIRRLGLEDATEMQLKGVLRPRIKDPREKGSGWDSLSLPMMSHGYAVELAPIHTLMLYNAVANGGKLITPVIVTDIMENGRSVESFGTRTVNPEICSGRTLRLLRECLEGTVAEGTASMLRNEVYTVAAKTGTAKIAQGKSGYKTPDGGTDYLGTVVGYFPADRPKYTLIVAIVTHHKPGGRLPYYGGPLSGPAFRAIADRVVALDTSLQPHAASGSPDKSSVPVDIKGGNEREIFLAAKELALEGDLRRRNRSWSSVEADSAGYSSAPITVSPDTVPSVMGMGLKDAVYLLGRTGLRTEFTGTGRVLAQLPEPGCPVPADGMVKLVLGNPKKQNSKR